MEEMELDGTDVRGSSPWPTTPPARRSRWWSSAAASRDCLAGIRLQEAGIPFTIVEKNAGVGGTWWENSYPGARVDVGNHFYCYSFEPSDTWTEFFAQQPELQSYFETVMTATRHRGARRDGRPRWSGPDGTTTPAPGRCGPGDRTVGRRPWWPGR